MTDSQKSDYKFDKLKMFFGEDYQLTDTIVIHQPSIGDVLEQGENSFYAMVNMFTANTTTYRVFLWDMGIDWNKISEIELFGLMTGSLTPNETKLIFGDFDWSKYQAYEYTTGEDEEGNPIKEKVLYSKDDDILITEDKFLEMKAYLREMFQIFPKNEFAKGKLTKEWMIDEDREKAKQREKENKDSSVLFPLISTATNYPGFKYKLQELREMGIVQFMDSINRIRIIEHSTAVMHGMMGGFVDGSKISPESYDLMRPIERA